MKKVFSFFGLLAIVAISHAAVNAAEQSTLTVNAGLSGASVCDIPVECHIGSGDPCTLTEGGPQYFLNDEDTGKCLIPLFRD